MFENFKLALRRRRVIKRNAPKGFFFALYMQPILLLGFMGGFVGLLFNFPWMPAYFIFMICSMTWNMWRYSNLWYDMLAAVHRNETAEDYALVVKDSY